MNRRRLPREAGSASNRFWRAVVSVSRVVAAFGVAAAVVCGAAYGWRTIRHGGRFVVRNVICSGNERVPSAELDALAGRLEGTNIFAVDLAAAARRMEKHPWIAHARVARDLPDTLRVTVEERTAAALLSAGGLYAIDAEGIPFKLAAASDHLDLPIISGVARDQLTNADGTANTDVLTALEIMDAYGARKLAVRAPLSEVHVSEEVGETSFIAYLGDDGFEANLGVVRPGKPDELKSLLDRLERVMDKLDDVQQRDARARSIDLGNRARPDWVPARLEALADSPADSHRTGTSKH